MRNLRGLAIHGVAFFVSMLLLATSCGETVAASATKTPPAGGDSEIWVTLQASSKLLILQGPRGHPSRATIDLPPATGPHIITFSPDGKYAYVSGMGNGDLAIIQADRRQLAATLHLGRAGTHQAKPSPSGSTLLVAQVPTQTLLKVSADETDRTWSVAGSLSFAPLHVAPVCSIFRDDGKRAYVSLNPTGLAIVDVETMTIVDTLPVAGFIACGMVKSGDGKSVIIASSGGGGHIYRLDTSTDRLNDLGALGASDWHSFNMMADQKLGVGSVPAGDELRVIDLTGGRARTAAVLPVHPTSGAGSDQPDAIGIRGGTAWVSLRKSGKLAVIDLAKGAVVTYLDVAPAAESINPANCGGCAVHGVTVRR